jgi:hypothetical protein
MTTVTDPAPNATPRPLSELEASPPAPTGARPWPAPSPNSDWWRGESDAAAENPAGASTAAAPRSKDEDTGTTPDATAGLARHAAKSTKPTVTYTNLAPKTPERAPEAPKRAVEAATPARGAVRPPIRVAGGVSTRTKPAVEPAPAAPIDHAAAAASAPGPVAGPQQADGPGTPATDEAGFPLWPEGQAPVGAPAERAPVAETAPRGGDGAWQASQLQVMRGGRRTTVKPTLPPPPRRATRKPRSPVLGLAALLLLSLLAGFFGWVSADPFWLAVGHARPGTATVTTCAGTGLQARCVGTFAGSSFSRDRVAVSALPPEAQRPGVTVAARMVSAQGRIAYAGRPAALHVRWILGMALVLLCGLGIGWATGAGRLASRRARLIGYVMSVAGPLVLFAGVLAVSW